MADTSWADNEEKRTLYARASALGADIFILSYENSVREFLAAKGKNGLFIILFKINSSDHQ